MVEPPAIQALQSLLAAADRVKLDEHLSLGVGINGDVDDLSVLLVALELDFILELLNPVSAVTGQLPTRSLAHFVIILG